MKRRGSSQRKERAPIALHWRPRGPSEKGEGKKVHKVASKGGVWGKNLRRGVALGDQGLQARKGEAMSLGEAKAQRGTHDAQNKKFLIRPHFWKGERGLCGREEASFGQWSPSLKKKLVRTRVRGNCGGKETHAKREKGSGERAEKRDRFLRGQTVVWHTEGKTGNMAMENGFLTHFKGGGDIVKKMWAKRRSRLRVQARSKVSQEGGNRTTLRK